MTANLVAWLKARTIDAAGELALPLGWHGDPFNVPAGPHLRGRVFFDSSAPAGVLGNPYTKVTGRLVLTVAAPVGADELAASLADRLKAFYPRGTAFDFEGGHGTITTPAMTPPAADGKRCTAMLIINFYAFVADKQE